MATMRFGVKMTVLLFTLIYALRVGGGTFVWHMTLASVSTTETFP